MISWSLFLLSLLPPLLLLVLGGIAPLSRQAHRPVAWRWFAALVALALWSSHLSSYVVEAGLPAGGGYSWRLAAGYALPVASLGVLWTTTGLLAAASRPERVSLGLGLLLLVAALLVDPALFWPRPFTPLLVAGARLRQFDLWAGIWGAAWVVPLLTALVLTLQSARRLPPSIYRGQVRYWLLLLAGLLLLGPLALLHDPGRPLWQIIAATGFIVVCSLGTASLTNRPLPDFRFTSRQLLRGLFYWVAGGLLVWVGLQLLAMPAGRRLLDRPAVLGALAVGGALLFLLMRQLIAALAARLLRSEPSPALALLPALDADFAGDPVALGNALCDSLRAALGVDDVWLCSVVGGPDAGELRLTPLTVGAPPPTAFATSSSFTRFLQKGERPLVRMDLETLPAYQALVPDERQALLGWQRELLVAVAAHDRPVALLGLGARRNGESYNGSDLRRLQTLADRAAPLLRQSAAAAVLQSEMRAAQAAAADLSRERDQALALLTLFRRALGLVQPALRDPLTEIDASWGRLARDLPTDLDPAAVDISLPLAHLKLSLGALLNAYARLQQQPLQPVREWLQIGELCQATLDALQAMAEARRVILTLEVASGLPAVYGSPPLLREALQQLVHNAIKFNKIGGEVAVRCATAQGAVRIDVADTGVGMTAEHLATLGEDLGAITGGERPAVQLGVALANYVALAHGGRLQAKSTYGAGSTLSLFLPVVPPENVSGA